MSVRNLNNTIWRFEPGEWTATPLLGGVYDINARVTLNSNSDTYIHAFKIGYDDTSILGCADSICIESEGETGITSFTNAVGFTLTIYDFNMSDNAVLTAMLVNWLESNGHLQKVADVTGSTWEISRGWTAEAGQGQYFIEGTLNDDTLSCDTHASLAIGYIKYADSYEAHENHLAYTYDSGTLHEYENDENIELLITGGTDATSTSLINWLYSNGKMIACPTDNTVLGTWKFNDTPALATDVPDCALTFLSGGVEWNSIGGSGVIYYDTSSVWQDGQVVYRAADTSWSFEPFKTICITSITSGEAELYTWLCENATKILSFEQSITTASISVAQYEDTETAIVDGSYGTCEHVVFPAWTSHGPICAIGTGAFYNRAFLKSIYLSAFVREIEVAAFVNCKSLDTIIYGGTVEMWNTFMTRAYKWNIDIPATHVTCSDGVVEIGTEEESLIIDNPEYVTLRGGTYVLNDVLTATPGLNIAKDWVSEVQETFNFYGSITSEMGGPLSGVLYDETQTWDILNCGITAIKSSGDSLAVTDMFAVAIYHPESEELISVLPLYAVVIAALAGYDGLWISSWTTEEQTEEQELKLRRQLQTITIPEQSVDWRFANWFIANSNYSEVNNETTTLLAGAYTFNSTISDFPNTYNRIYRGFTLSTGEQLSIANFKLADSHEEYQAVAAGPRNGIFAGFVYQQSIDGETELTGWNEGLTQSDKDALSTIAEDSVVDTEFATWFIKNTNYIEVTTGQQPQIQAGFYNVKPTVDLSSFDFDKTYSVNFFSSFILFDRIRLQKDDGNDSIYYITPQDKELEVYNSGNTPCWNSKVTKIFFDEDQSVPSVVYNLINALLDQPIPTTTLAKGVYKFNNDIDVSTPFEEYFYHEFGITGSFVGLTCADEENKKMLATLGISTIWNNNVIVIPSPVYLEDYKWGTNSWSIFLGHKLTSDMLRTHFLLKDTLVTESFATWYKANSNYEEVNNNLVLLEARQYMFKENIAGIPNSNVTWLYQDIGPYYPLKFTTTDDPDTFYDFLSCCSINTKENAKLDGSDNVVDMNNYTKLLYKSTVGDTTTTAYESGSRSVTSEGVTTTQEFSGWASDNMRMIELPHACYVSQEFFDWFVANTDYNTEVEDTVDIPSGTYRFYNSIEPFDVSTNNSYELQFNSFYGEYDHIICQSIDSGWTLSYESTEHEFIYECFNSTFSPQWKNDLAQKITIKSNVTVPYAFGTWFLKNTEIVEVNEIPSTIQYGTNIVTIGMNQTASLDCTNTLMRDNVTVILGSDATVTYKDNSQIIDKGSSVVFDCKDKFIAGDISVTIEQLDDPRIYIEDDTLSIYGEYPQGTTATVYVDDVETLTVVRAPDPVPDPEPDPDPTPVPQPFRIVNPLEGSSLNEEENYADKVVYEYEFENGTPAYVLVNGVRSDTSVTLPIHSSGGSSVDVTITVSGEVSIHTYVDVHNPGTYHIDCDVTFIDGNLNTVQDTFRIYGHVDVCFAAGTLISTPTGYVAIENMNEGATIHSYNWMTELVEEDNVAKFEIKNGSRDIHYVSFNNGNRIGVTSTHSFMTEDGWKCIAPNEHTITDQQLVIGDKVQTSENTFTVVTNIETDTRIQPIYHITLAKNNCLLVASNEKFIPVLAEHLSSDWEGKMLGYNPGY